MVKCPECGGRMVKFGRLFSGRELKQNYGCTKCGRKKVFTIVIDVLPKKK